MGLFCKKINRRDIDYVEKLYQTYGTYIFHISNNIVNNCCDAEDITQEIFIKLMNYQLFKRFQGSNESQIKQYLYRMVYCQSITFLEKRKKELRWIIDLEKEDIIGIDQIPGESNIEKFWNHMEHEVLEDLLKKLPQSLAKTMKYYYLDEFLIYEIAQVFSIKETTIRKRLQRGREKLRKSYAKEEQIII